MFINYLYLFAGDDGNNTGDAQCNSVRLQDLHAQQQSGETIPEEEGGSSSSDERDPSPEPSPTPLPHLAETPWREVTVSGGE